MLIPRLFQTDNHPKQELWDARPKLRKVAADDPDYPREAVHGSYMTHWPSIRSQGLSRMTRTHIHLAPGLPGEGRVISGE